MTQYSNVQDIKTGVAGLLPVWYDFSESGSTIEMRSVLKLHRHPMLDHRTSLRTAIDGS